MDNQTIALIIIGAYIFIWLIINTSFIIMFSLNKKRISMMKEVLELNAKNLLMNNQDIMEIKASTMKLDKIVKLLDKESDEEGMDTKELIVYKKKQARKLWNEAKALAEE